MFNQRPPPSARQPRCGRRLHPPRLGLYGLARRRRGCCRGVEECLDGVATLDAERRAVVPLPSRRGRGVAPGLEPGLMPGLLLGCEEGVEGVERTDVAIARRGRRRHLVHARHGRVQHVPG
eukprot:scaffold19762_cov65-Phaeocystis_antarctica.AAC.5